MASLIAAALSHARAVMLLLILILVGGTVSYLTIPKESDPDIDIPIIYVSVGLDGISPEDGERLLVKPLEKELKSIDGVKEVRSLASQGHASVTLEFEAGFNADQALLDVREKVDIAKTELPEAAKEPVVHEVNIALFPILTVTLAGNVPERSLVQVAHKLQDAIEALPGVLEVKIAGEREEVVEVLVDRAKMESYGINQQELGNLVGRNNVLVAAGSLQGESGNYPIKVPGLLETASDINNLPIKVVDGEVIRLHDIATVRRTFKDATSYARVSGKPALALKVSKRIGANVIQTIDHIRALVAEGQKQWPAAIQVGFVQDKSTDIRSMMGELQNSVLSAVLLVVIVIIGILGVRTAGLVGLAIPGSFLIGILALSIMGLTINMVVLFSLIMAVGMLVDGAIVVTEFADRKMSEGLHRKQAYSAAARRMALPITASTATTLAAFMPLLFWPGIMGEFMRYLPITLIATLSASLLMALIFVPTLGGLIGKAGAISPKAQRNLRAAEEGDLAQVNGFSGWYIRVLNTAIHRPWLTLIASILVFIGIFGTWNSIGPGTEFFPEVEPRNAAFQVRARGDLSLQEADVLVRQAEQQMLGMPEFAHVFVEASTNISTNQGAAKDVVGSINVEFKEWDERRPAAETFLELAEKAKQLPGIIVESQPERGGPVQGKPIKLELSVPAEGDLIASAEQMQAVADHIAERMRALGGFTAIEDSRLLSNIEWRLEVDRAEAARYGVDVLLIGNSIQLVTNGILVGDYRPDDADDELEIRVRYAQADRYLEQLDQLKIQTTLGLVPLSHFVERTAAPRVSQIDRVDGRRIFKIEADVAEGAEANERIAALKADLKNFERPADMKLRYRGEQEEQLESMIFLLKAMLVALFVMFIILVMQFNSFYQAFLILSAIGFSTAGVLLGLLIRNEPFGIIMSGIGVISLAGIVVNNNIVLIDTYNVLIRAGMPHLEAILRTGAQRLRPVLLTTTTTILGLMPMVLKMNVDLFGRSIDFGSPSTQYWSQLATAVAGGLAFATILTLVVTPCLLALKRPRPKQPLPLEA